MHKVGNCFNLNNDTCGWVSPKAVLLTRTLEQGPGLRWQGPGPGLESQGQGPGPGLGCQGPGQGLESVITQNAK